MIPFPNKKYKIIYADPPWEYYLHKNCTAPVTKYGKVGRKHQTGLPERYYKTLSIDEIKLLPINKITDDDCFLFLWSTFPMIREQLEVIDSWGFKYITVAFVWIKTGYSNNFPKRQGLGSYTRSNAEIVFLAKKGHPKVNSTAVQQVVLSTLSEHSKKPDEVRKRILKLCGDLPRIELFARTKVHGWDVWGNDEKLEAQPLENFL